ncbi:hypothetical protein BT93_J1515 [Corymbia citriodora subsp. variegata]|nr:hypothetical protein BT93_J1515 [Corymbia citriodora subsp. variegata]KAF8010899.1 hypothetical protein BT93_J1515 [Corymbia citriodora subsp. variegata]KAF8010902.1 hypothetical protein BT93_J1515 [Corymbia citriodora subsp. variegata]
MSKQGDAGAFYVVRKGDLIGVYKAPSDCLAQAGPSVHSPGVSVYKGNGLPEETEEYLKSHGLRNASYTISAADLKNDIFGELVPCPFQQPVSKRGASFDKALPTKRSVEAFQWDHEAVGPTSALINYPSKHLKLNDGTASQPASSNCSSCSLEFDGASRGNPGPAGAGAILRANDGSLVWRLREGVGIATNNVAEYRALILGLRQALQKGFKKIQIRGDSMLVCMQIQEKWKLKNQNMADLCKVAKELKDRFTTFQIGHVRREFNSEADAQANQAISLKDGQVEVDCGQQ